MDNPKEAGVLKKVAWLKLFIMISIALALIYTLAVLFLKLSYCISWLGAAVLYTVCLYILAYEICRLCIFPGSFWLWKRALERARSELFLAA